MLMADTLLCVGLDPDMRKLPHEILEMTGSDEEKVFEFLCGVVNVTVEHVCAYKAQKAFFDLFPGGHDLLREIITYIHGVDPMVSVIVDSKVGDIENTMEAYATNVLDHMGADGIVVNPYMGDDVIDPFMDYPDKAVVVLAKTSNLKGSTIQDVFLQSGQMLWEYILDHIVGSWNREGNLIPVLAATSAINMGTYRSRIPDDMPILLAGVGAQGGRTSDVRVLLNKSGVGVFVNSSRGILYSNQCESWQDSVAAAAIDLKMILNMSRK
jgi:orotidine-5'-phosphate decarboxylase